MYWHCVWVPRFLLISLNSEEWFQQSLKDHDLVHAPVKSAADKWELLPAFVKSRGLVNQHIESFDHFLDVTLERIRKANEKVKCDADPGWYLLYKVRVEKGCSFFSCFFFLFFPLFS